jgi:uncharacterized protein YggT (Ycf19 family)
MKDEKSFPTDSEMDNGKIVEKTNRSTHTSGEKTTKIKFGRVDSLVIYEVSEGEIEIIERGSPNSTYLNFSIFLISICLSFIVTILTCDFTNKDRLFMSFLSVTIITGIIGIFLLLIWFRSKNDVDEVIKKIKERIIE